MLFIQTFNQQMQEKDKWAIKKVANCALRTQTHA